MSDIRQYQDRDLDAVKNLIGQLQSHEQQFDPAHVEPTQEFIDWYVSRLFKTVDTEHGIMLVATLGEKVCGFAAAHRREETDYSVDFFYIAELVVDAAYRGQGIGSELIRAMEDFARTHSFQRLMIGVLTDNVRAYKLYKSVGFREFAVDLIKPL